MSLKIALDPRQAPRFDKRVFGAEHKPAVSWPWVDVVWSRSLIRTHQGHWDWGQDRGRAPPPSFPHYIFFYYSTSCPRQLSPPSSWREVTSFERPHFSHSDFKGHRRKMFIFCVVSVACRHFWQKTMIVISQWSSYNLKKIEFPPQRCNNLKLLTQSSQNIAINSELLGNISCHTCHMSAVKTISPLEAVHFLH